MGKHRALESRTRIKERLDTDTRDLDEGEEKLDEAASDVVTVNRTKRDIQPGGTSEGADAVFRILEDADGDARENLNEADGDLEQTQETTQEHREDTRENATDAADNRSVLQSGQSEIHHRETSERLKEADAAVTEDIEFLESMVDTLDRISQESKQTRDKILARIHTAS